MPVTLSGGSPTFTSGYAGGAVTSGTAVASTSGTSIDFTSIPSWVKRVTVLLSGVSTNGSSPLIIRLGTSGGFLTSGYLGSVCQTAVSSVSSGNTTTGIGLQLSVGGASIFHAMVTIDNVTGNTWVASGTGGYSDGAGIIATGCTIPLSGALTQVRVQATNGTDAFDAGSINILYE